MRGGSSIRRQNIRIGRNSRNNIIGTRVWTMKFTKSSLRRPPSDTATWCTTQRGGHKQRDSLLTCPIRCGHPVVPIGILMPPRSCHKRQRRIVIQSLTVREPTRSSIEED